MQLVENDMIVGLGTGSTAALAIEVLARRHGQGLRFVDIPTSERTASQAAAAGIPLTSFEANGPAAPACTTVLLRARAALREDADALLPGHRYR